MFRSACLCRLSARHVFSERAAKHKVDRNLWSKVKKVSLKRREDGGTLRVAIAQAALVVTAAPPQPKTPSAQVAARCKEEGVMYPCQPWEIYKSATVPPTLASTGTNLMSFIPAPPLIEIPPESKVCTRQSGYEQVAWYQSFIAHDSLSDESDGS